MTAHVLQSAARVLAAALLCGACGGASAYQPIPLEEATRLHSQVQTFYESTDQMMQETSLVVGRVGDLPDGVNPQDFEIQLVKSALMSCFSDSLVLTDLVTDSPRLVAATVGSDTYQPLTVRSNLGLVEHCDPPEMISLESYLTHAPTRIRSFIIERVLTVDSLRVNLKHVLPERLNLLDEVLLDGRGDVARLRQTSNERYAIVINDEGAFTAEQRLRTETDYETIQNELDQVNDLLDEVEIVLPDYRRQRRTLLEDVSVELSAMGTPES